MSHPEIEAEQAYISRAHELLGAARERATRLRSMVEVGRGGTRQALFERDAIEGQVANRLAQLELGPSSLVFGRVDHVGEDSSGDEGSGGEGSAGGEPSSGKGNADGEYNADSSGDEGSADSSGYEPNAHDEPRTNDEYGPVYYIGRIAVADENQEPVVVDWRARIAEPFFRATACEPMGLLRRRHFVIRGSELLDIEDEIFELDAFFSREGESAPDAAAGRHYLRAHGALYAALEERRDGQMRDVVATIQADQDEIVRSPLPGILVVQGGPGTGKTVVALHRAAYLLYTNRFPLTDQGLLVLGPNRLFLRYIERVLPSLGEVGAHQYVLADLFNDLFPDVRITRADAPAAAEVKGSERMSEVLLGTLKFLQRPLTTRLRVFFEGTYLTLTPQRSREIISEARRRFSHHNAAVRFVENAVFTALAESQPSSVAGDEAVAGERSSLYDPDGTGAPVDDYDSDHPNNTHDDNRYGRHTHTRHGHGSGVATGTHGHSHYGRHTGNTHGDKSDFTDEVRVGIGEIGDDQFDMIGAGLPDDDHDDADVDAVDAADGETEAAGLGLHLIDNFSDTGDDGHHSPGNPAQRTGNPNRTGTTNWSGTGSSVPPPRREPAPTHIIRERLESHASVVEALKRMWPPLSPAELLHDLFGSAALMAASAKGVLSDDEQAALHRPRSQSIASHEWSDSDVPLLDEAYNLLGPRPNGHQNRLNGHQNRLNGNQNRPPDTEIRTFGHIVIDEAQDFSPMALRMIARRSLNGSMTVVGDIAQTTSPGAVADWDAILGYLRGRGKNQRHQREPTERRHELTLSYRIPAPSLEPANRVLAVHQPNMPSAVPVRTEGPEPLFIVAEPGPSSPPNQNGPTRADGVATTARTIAQLTDASHTVLVVAPPSLIDELEAAMTTAGLNFGRATAASRNTTGSLHPTVTLATVELVKGLEADAVLVMEPAAIVAEEPHGLGALYVALTRATRQVAVVFALALPEALGDVMAPAAVEPKPE